MLVVLFELWNIAVFCLYGIDKRKAIKGEWRISEKTLLACAFFMGGTGAFLGMKFFRHKTQKLLFKILVPVALVLNYIVIFYGWIY